LPTNERKETSRNEL